MCSNSDNQQQLPPLRAHHLPVSANLHLPQPQARRANWDTAHPDNTHFTLYVYTRVAGHMG